MCVCCGVQEYTIFGYPVISRRVTCKLRPASGGIFGLNTEMAVTIATSRGDTWYCCITKDGGLRTRRRRQPRLFTKLPNAKGITMPKAVRFTTEDRTCESLTLTTGENSTELSCVSHGALIWFDRQSAKLKIFKGDVERLGYTVEFI
jgi:hypothetical protein